MSDSIYASITGMISAILFGSLLSLFGDLFTAFFIGIAGAAGGFLFKELLAPKIKTWIKKWKS